ncbi:unnamed protein product [Leptosia nina]|uniref:Uncharacterized protein n=1 Tax=Leptosia nina TaxID=320188 RepID=A0AAV1JPY4_9NEOP
MNCPHDDTDNCRYDFVQRWLDAHAKYFKSTPVQDSGETYVAYRTYGPSQVHYGYTGVIQYTPNVVRLPYTMQPPFRISPTQPPKL